MEAAGALEPVDQGMEQQFGQTELGHAGEQGHRQPMGARMGNQPPAPGESGVATGAFLPRHAIALQAEIADEMGHGEQQQQGQAGGAGIRRHRADLELSPQLEG